MYMEVLYKYQQEIFTLTDYHMECPVNHESIPDFGRNRDYKKRPYFKIKETSLLDSVEELKQYYSDKTKKVTTRRLTLVVEEKENSISLKFYSNSTGRGVGKTYFGRTNSLYYVTFNKKYKNFYSGQREIKGKTKKVAKRIRTNDFKDINSLLSIIPHYIRDVEIEKNMGYGASDSYDILYNALQIFFNKIYGTKSVEYNMNSFKELFYQTYMKFNDFKVPDEYKKFIDIQIPKSLLKKHGNIVNAFMKIYDLRGSKVRKLLNSNRNLKLNHLYTLYNMLGVDFFNRIEETVFSKVNDGVYSYGSDTIYMENIEYDLNNYEKKNIVSVINEAGFGTGHILALIKDHIRFKEKLNGYGEKVKIKASTYKSFSREHDEWAALVDSYRKGKVTRYYSDDMVREIEQPLIGPHIDYYPILLQVTEQYVGESQHQSNCVRTYTEHPNCFIVSLREGSENGKERATIEYRYMSDGNINRVQSLGRHNNPLSNNWNYALESLDHRINSLNEGNVIVLPKIKKEFPNGHVIYGEATWNDDENKYPNRSRGKVLKWNNEYQMSEGSLFLGFHDDFLEF